MKCIYVFNKNVATWLIELQLYNMKIQHGPNTLSKLRDLNANDAYI